MHMRISSCSYFVMNVTIRNSSTLCDLVTLLVITVWHPRQQCLTFFMYRSSPRPDYGTKIYDFKIELVFHKSNHSASDNIFNICGLNGAMTEICP